MIQTYSSTIRRKEMDAVLTCLVEEKTGPGELNERLVQLVKEKLGVSGAFALRSPSLALKYALKLLAPETNSKIMVSALAPDWQYSAILDLGYEPLVLDVSPENGLVSPESVQNGIKDGGRLLILHETSGLLPNFEAILELGVPVIEDISQSIGATTNEKQAGTFGVFTILGLEQEDILTSGGGAVLIAPQQRDWTVLKQLAENAPTTDCLPDINAALAYVQLKEHSKNELIRREMYEIYIRSLMQSRHKTLIQQGEYAVQVIYSFPVLLSSGLKDVKQYTSKKDIEIRPAFEHSIITKRGSEDTTDENIKKCINANSLALRCVNFPLYPMLGGKNAAKIAKVLATLP